jgi:glutamate-5-semialdehyde dehydrogenase
MPDIEPGSRGIEMDMTTQMQNDANARRLVSDMVATARAAQTVLAESSHAARRAGLTAAAKHIRENVQALMTANAADLEVARTRNQSAAMIDRLTLNDARIEGMAAGLEAIATLPDPLGATLAEWTRPNGLNISRISTPLGIIGVIYEARPNVTIDAGGLCVISGNAVILRAGSDSQNTSSCLAKLLSDGLEEAGLPAGAVQIVPSTDRAIVGAMLAAAGEIDVIIPRGGKSLVERVQTEARVPVFAHLEGICHVYVSQHADQEKARQIVVNAKMRRTGICGAAETLLIDKNGAEAMLPVLAADLIAAGCQLRGDDMARAIMPDMDVASEDDWRTEYLDSIISVRVVDGLQDAMTHIATYGSHHTDCIVSEDQAEIESFLARVDSAIVMVNASTQFADGGEFGMGAEIGIATGRLHARGPVGAAQLTSFKYIVRGNGQTRPQ